MADRQQWIVMICAEGQAPDFLVVPADHPQMAIDNALAGPHTFEQAYVVGPVLARWTWNECAEELGIEGWSK